MTNGLSVDPATGAEVRGGRRVPFTPIPHWVLHLEGLSHLGLRVYALLLSHLNASRGDTLAWPSQDNLADMAGVHRNSISKVINTELVPLGLAEIRIHRYGDNNTRRRNVYVVHELPPPGYEGVVSTGDWYVLNSEPDANPQVSPDALSSVRPDAQSGVHPDAQHGVQELEEAITRTPPPPSSVGPQEDEEDREAPAGQDDENIEITSDDLLMAERLLDAVPWPSKVAVGIKNRKRIIARLSMMAAKGWTEEMVRDLVKERIPDWKAARYPASLVAQVLEDSPLETSEAFTAPVEGQEDTAVKELQEQVDRLEIQHAQQKLFIADCLECDELGYVMPPGTGQIQWHGHGPMTLGNDKRKLQAQIAKLKDDLDDSPVEHAWDIAS